MSEIQNSPRLKSLKVLVTGDACWDHYHYGDVKRISPEAPIPVFNKVQTHIKDGMGANVNKNVLRLCDNKNAGHTFAVHFGEQKNRYIDRKFKQQLFRVDEPLSDKGRDKVYDRAMNAITALGANLVIVSDYDKGTLSYEQIEDIIRSASVRGVPVFIDTKKRDLARFRGAFIKINEAEYEARTSDCPNMIVTRAENGVIFYPPPPHAPRWLPVAPIEFIDVTGAGDTFLAALAFMYHISQDIDRSIAFANSAARVTIQHLGCYAPTLEEIINA